LKSGSDWTSKELIAYNIRVFFTRISPLFFGDPQINKEVLTAKDVSTVQSDDAYMFLRTMDLAMATPPGEESAVDDLAVRLFRALR